MKLLTVVDELYYYTLYFRIRKGTVGLFSSKGRLEKTLTKVR